MPSPYRRDVARLRAEILGRVLAGEALRGIYGAAGMPCVQTVRTWAKADPLFAAELLAARRRGDWARRLAFDEAKAAVFLSRARAGETINALLREPGMPSRRAYNHWKATEAPFAEAVCALRQRRDEGIGAHGRARRRDFDPALADRIIVGLHRGFPLGLKLEDVLAADPEMPCRPTLARWRREAPGFDRVLRMIFASQRARRGATVPAPLVEEVADHIVRGGSFASYSRLAGGPSRTTLRRWFRADGDFAEAVSEACDWREEWYGEQIAGIAQMTPPGPVREMERAVGPLKRHLVRLRHRPGGCIGRAGQGTPPAVEGRSRLCDRAACGGADVWWIVTMKALCILAVSAALLGAAPVAAAPPNTVEGVTVPAPRADRERIDAYVQHITAGHDGESLTRWHEPVCPLVAGLKSDQAEGVLARISELAKLAGAPVAADPHCRANLYVVVTSDPKTLLEGWSRHDISLFGEMGGQAIRRIIDTNRPVRVWHNITTEPTDGRNQVDDEPGVRGVPEQRGATGSHLVNNVERQTHSVVVVVDAIQAHGVTLAQLADYVAMTGLAEIDLDATLADAPSILHLFDKSGPAPTGLSKWDEAFLKALYRTPQRNRTQRSQIVGYVVEAMNP